MGRKQNVHRTTINGFSILDEVWMMKIFECCIYHCNPGSGVLDEGDGWGSVTAPAIVLGMGWHHRVVAHVFFRFSKIQLRCIRISRVRQDNGWCIRTSSTVF